MRIRLSWPGRHDGSHGGELELVERELGGRLDAHAAALEPDPDVLVRARAELLARFAEARSTAIPPSRRRRLALPLVAATVLAATSLATATAASDPGEPFYGLRLAIERLSLPATASDRAIAQLDHLERRLTEAREASRRGNGRGVADALAAYESQLVEAVRPGFGPPGLGIALERHRRLLETMVPGLPSDAQDEVTDALQRLEGVLETTTGTPGAPVDTPAPRDPGPPTEVPSGRP